MGKVLTSLSFASCVRDLCFELELLVDAVAAVVTARLRFALCITLDIVNLFSDGGEEEEVWTEAKDFGELCSGDACPVGFVSEC